MDVGAALTTLSPIPTSPTSPLFNTRTSFPATAYPFFYPTPPIFESKPYAKSSTPDPNCPGRETAGVAGALLAHALQFFAAAQCVLDQSWPKNGDITNNSLFDFIVVGGGTAGSVVASRLVELNFTVLVVEAGVDPPRDSTIPGLRGTLMHTAYDWNLTSVNEGQNGTGQGLLKGMQALPRGKILGGTGSINDMVYSRGFPADYDDWALTLGEEWNWDHVLPYFKKSEHLTDERIINDPELVKLHGQNGAIEVGGFNASTFDTDMFISAFREAGFKMVKDMTNPNEIGVGRHSHTIRDGQRDSTLTAFLNKAAKRNNLVVLKNAVVTKILIMNNTAVGVNVLVGEEVVSYFVTKEVIVSAGTYHTPKLLMLSGIGPEKHLHEMGINVVKDSPVGENLQDHVMVLSFIASDNGTCYTDQATGHMNTIRYFYDRSGPFSVVNTMAAYLALNGSTQPNVPDFAFYPSCMQVGTPFYHSCMHVLRLNENLCTKMQNILKDRELITVATVLMKPKSRGDVKLKSSDPFDAPLIHAGTFSDQADLEGYPEATRVVESIVKSSYFKRKNANIVDLNLEMCAGMAGDELVKCQARATGMSAWHCVGTAAMGSVVDSKLRVNGVFGLRVVDASVMPKVTRGNTNAPVVMIAEKAADFLKAQWLSL